MEMIDPIVEQKRAVTEEEKNRNKEIIHTYTSTCAFWALNAGKGRAELVNVQYLNDKKLVCSTYRIGFGCAFHMAF